MPHARVCAIAWIADETEYIHSGDGTIGGVRVDKAEWVNADMDVGVGRWLDSRNGDTVMVMVMVRVRVR